MTYPDQLEEKLGFDQVRQAIRNYCSSTAAIRRVDEIHFLADRGILLPLLEQAFEFKQIIERGESFPSQHFYDPADWYPKIFPEGNYLDEHELLDLARSLETVGACITFLQKSKDSYPVLFALSEPVTAGGGVIELINSKIDDRAMVRDSASPELNRIRRRLREEQSRLRKLSEQIFARAVSEKWVPEGALPTIRDGRVVIPVLAEHKRRIRGLILDESATGQTVFMEPAEMLEANNEIREQEHAEKREVIRILKSLTDDVRTRYDVLVVALGFLTEIDFIRAKARYAIVVEGNLPEVTHEPQLALRQARHPMLFLSLRGKRGIVPLDIELNPVHRMLLVSGPNAGGKSVCLKTVGLLQYMLQCGLLVPAHPDSVMGIFESIFLDIGDQQSIENDLSTYSSHLRNMNVFIRDADARSMVLVDEMGSGTDPNFGGAIAQAILHALLEKKVWGVATTHYYNLKVFAGQHEGVRNAAMRFDEKNLVPLYVLDIGKPGSSFALEIARKTGLPEATLEEAGRLAGKELSGFEALMRKLEREQQELRDKQTAMEAREADLRRSLEKYTSLSAELDAKKKEIMARAKAEAQRLLSDTNRQIEKTIRHIRENRAEKKETLKVRKGLQELKGRITSPEAAPRQDVPLKQGDYVRITGQDGRGIIQSIKGKNALVQFGEIKSFVDLKKLEKAPTGRSEREVAKTNTGFSLLEKRAGFNSTLDLRGKRAEEVGPLLDQFMDTAILLGAGELSILHGKGEGVLRKIVREHLKRYRDVESVSDEHIDRGGDGITLVVLR
ncbi:MAG TPA: Smr/MutS family protein [Cyclobacteriaceae bacterium]|nr:Smr/MutS family protein [Cyclobacteriaceae bacterium]